MKNKLINLIIDTIWWVTVWSIFTYVILKYILK